MELLGSRILWGVINPECKALCHIRPLVVLFDSPEDTDNLRWYNDYSITGLRMSVFYFVVLQLIEALFVQAFGAGQVNSLAIIFQRTVAFLATHCFLLTLLVLSFPSILQAAGEDADIIRSLKAFSRALLLNIWLDVFNRSALPSILLWHSEDCLLGKNSCSSLHYEMLTGSLSISNPLAQIPWQKQQPLIEPHCHDLYARMLEEGPRDLVSVQPIILYSPHHVPAEV